MEGRSGLKIGIMLKRLLAKGCPGAVEFLCGTLDYLRVRGGMMLVEMAKPIALALCMASLCALFLTAVLAPANEVEHRLWDAVILLAMATGVCLSSGMLFREGRQEQALLRTLPVQLLLWTVGLMLVLFVASWYLETYCVFYKDVRRF